MHNIESPLAGNVVTIKSGDFAGSEYRIEDWWDRVGGKSWMWCEGNAACLNYGVRSGFGGLPLDDEVLYGKIGSLGHLIHISEL